MMNECTLKRFKPRISRINTEENSRRIPGQLSPTDSQHQPKSK